MRMQVQKWGNSLALRIPRSFALDSHIKGYPFEVSLPSAAGRREAGDVLVELE